MCVEGIGCQERALSPSLMASPPLSLGAPGLDIPGLGILSLVSLVPPSLVTPVLVTPGLTHVLALG